MDLLLGSQFCSIDLLVCFVPVPYCLDYCSFVVLSEVREYGTSSFVLGFTDLLLFLWSLFYLFPLSSLLFASSCWLWALFVLLFLIPLELEGWSQIWARAVLTIFKVYSLVALSTFTLLCNHHHHPSPELAHLPKLKLYSLNTNYPFHLYPPPSNHHSTFWLYEFDYSRFLI